MRVDFGSEWLYTIGGIKQRSAYERIIQQLSGRQTRRHLAQYASVNAQAGFAGPECLNRWSLRQVIGLKVLRDARRQGASIMAAVAGYDLVRGMDEVTLRQRFADGRRYLVLFGESMILSLVTHDRAFDQKLRDDAMRQAVPLIVLDVERIMEEIRSRVTENFHKRANRLPENFQATV